MVRTVRPRVTPPLSELAVTRAGLPASPSVEGWGREGGAGEGRWSAPQRGGGLVGCSCGWMRGRMQMEVRVQLPSRCDDVECPARSCEEGEQTREAELSGHWVWHTVGPRVPRRRPVAEWGWGAGNLGGRGETAAGPRSSRATEMSARVGDPAPARCAPVKTQSWGREKSRP